MSDRANQNEDQVTPAAPETPDARGRKRYPRCVRLSGDKAYSAVFSANLRKSLGPIVVCGRPNDLPFNRLGLSVPRRVGNAVRRTRVKRQLREAFRLTHDQWPQGFDLVIVVRPHPSLKLEDYQVMLERGVRFIAKRAAPAS